MGFGLILTLLVLGKCSRLQNILLYTRGRIRLSGTQKNGGIKTFHIFLSGDVTIGYYVKVLNRV